MIKINLFGLLVLVHFTNSLQDILKYGAIKNEDSLTAQLANQKAINHAIEIAKSKDSEGDARVVAIPNYKFYSLPIVIDQAQDIIIEIRGKLLACNRIKNWPKKNSFAYQDFIFITNSRNITLNGGGKIDGRGYVWWLNSWLVTKKYMPPHTVRPHIINTDSVHDLTIHDLVLKNSPSFHLRTVQTINAKIYNIDIKVNTTAQLDILKRRFLLGTIPLFPLNTDGIDPYGKNFHIFNITCQNYDDVVVTKPIHSEAGQLVNCTQDMLIQNITARLGVGLSVGSVGPNTNCNCIKNITFRNAVLEKPLKGIYIKTNPGDVGDGVIDNILYQNITMHEPIWWAIYIGPQQQKQPDKEGPGCILYPFDPKGTCETQKRINITNIKLKNVLIKNSLLFPIIIRCNESNPCSNITFENVQARKWWIGKKDKGYVCENVHLNITNSYPKIECTFTNKTRLLTQQPQLEEHPGSISALILQKMQQASKQIPYIQEDDEMFLTEAQLQEDQLSFRQHLLTIESI